MNAIEQLNQNPDIQAFNQALHTITNEALDLPTIIMAPTTRKNWRFVYDLSTHAADTKIIELAFDILINQWKRIKQYGKENAYLLSEKQIAIIARATVSMRSLISVANNDREFLVWDGSHFNLEFVPDPTSLFDAYLIDMPREERRAFWNS